MNNEDQIYELIEKFDFTQLNKEQQKIVLLEITMEEYNEMRKVSTLTSDYFDNEPILMAEDLVVPTVKKENVIIRIINYKLPIYKIAAILVLVLCVDKLIPKEPIKEAQFSEISNDTISNSEAFLAYNMYSSKNSIKYDTGLSRVYN